MNKSYTRKYTIGKEQIPTPDAPIATMITYSDQVADAKYRPIH